MNKNEITQILACLPKDMTPFAYVKDGYALMLLSQWVGPGRRIAEIKQSPYQGLLNKPVVRRRLQAAGAGRLTAAGLRFEEADAAEPFILTVGQWDGRSAGNQTSRRGLNLVLQLNVSAQHQARYRELVRPQRPGLFNYGGHPVLRPGQRPYFTETLAWARIDLDLGLNEALIEEVQSDWVRLVRGALQVLERHPHKREGRAWKRRVGGSATGLRAYAKEVLAMPARIWPEAMLAAAIDFIHRELGIDHIYYHSAEAGAAAKGIDYRLPPRSLYTDLPRRFCFNKVVRPPTFLVREPAFRAAVRKLQQPYWYQLKL